MAQPGCLGPLRQDREYRFQDIIVSKRLGTIEMRIFDPIPEIFRLREIVDCLIAIAAYKGQVPFSREDYNARRKKWTVEGRTPWITERWQELQQIYAFPTDLLENTLSDRLRAIAEENSIEAAYAEVERIWREGTDISPEYRPYSRLRAAAGLAGYYAIRLPFMAYKGYKEWYG
jgi:gamma-glutamyl:cysteine ligase YbdK (ATP-grasp superfamily)